MAHERQSSPDASRNFQVKPPKSFPLGSEVRFGRVLAVLCRLDFIEGLQLGRVEGMKSQRLEGLKD